MPRFRSKSTPLFAALICALPAFAQQVAPPDASLPDTTLPVVRARSAASVPLPLRTDVRQEEEKLAMVPGGTNLAQPQQEARLATLRDALDYQPGLVIQDFFGGTDQPRLNLRGSGIQSNPVNRGVLLLQDGMPLNEADGSFIIGLIEPRDSALVSVRRGANSRHPASNSLGGEIDFHSMTGADERGRIRLELGSFGRQALQVAGGTVGEATDTRASVSSDRYDGYRHHSASQRDAVRGNFGLRGNGSFENRSSLSWTDLRFLIPAVVPKSRVESDPRGVMGDGASAQDTLLSVYKRDPRRESTQTRLSNRSRWGDDRLSHEVGVYWQDTQDLFNNQTSYTVTDSRLVGAQWRATGSPEAMASALTWTAALSWARSDMDRALYATSPQTGQALQRFALFDLAATTESAVAGSVWRLSPAVQAVADFQLSRVLRDARNVGTGSALDQGWTSSNPKLGVIWTPAPSARWYANLSRSTEAPTFWEIVSSTVAANNPSNASAELVKLRLQKATTAEMGGQGRFGDAAYGPDWTFSVYRSELRDELMSTTDANGVKVGTYNYLGGTRHQGIEAGLKGRVGLATFAGAIAYRVAWTYSDFRFKSGEYAGNHIAGIPRHLISAELLWASGAWRLGPNLRWLPSDTPTDHANTSGSQQDAYAVLGFKLEWRDGPWTAYVLADNVSDERYASSFAIRNKATAESPGYLPGLGRSYSVGLSHRF